MVTKSREKMGEYLENPKDSERQKERERERKIKLDKQEIQKRYEMIEGNLYAALN